MSRFLERIDTCLGAVPYPLRAWTWRLWLCSFAAVIGTSFTTGFVVHQYVKFSTIHPGNGDDFKSQQHWQVFLAGLLPLVFFANQMVPFMGPAAAMSTRIGHRKTLMIGAIVGFSACLIALAQAIFIRENIHLVFLFRSLVCGMFGMQSANGLVVAPAYLVEVAPDSARGSCGALYGFFHWAGVGLSILIDNAQIVDSEKTLLFALPGVGLFLYAIQFVALAFAEESPRWLVVEKQEEAAVLVVIRLQNCSRDQALAQVEEIISLDDELPPTSATEAQHCYCVCCNGVKELVWPLFLGSSVLAANFWTGAHIVDQLRIVEVIINDGDDESDLKHSQAIQAIVLPLLVLFFLCLMALCVLLVDRIGRRRLILIGLIFMTFSYIPISVGVVLQDTTAVHIGLGIFMASYCIGPGPIGMFMVAEMFDQRVRICALSVCHLAIQFIPASWFEMHVTRGLYEYFLMPFAIFFCIFEAVLLYLFLPETKQVPLERAVAKFQPEERGFQFRLDFVKDNEDDTSVFTATAATHTV